MTTTCHLGSAASPITVRLSASKPGGSAYTAPGGEITLADNAVSLPAANCDPSAVSDTVADAFSSYAGLPTSTARVSLSGVLTLVRAAATGGGAALGTSAPAAAPTPAASDAVLCVVPRLKGRRLKAARKALRRAHCRLGKVSRRKAPRRAGRVLKQSRRPGRELPEGTRVALRVGRR